VQLISECRRGWRQERVVWSLHQVPLAPGKTQHAVKNKNRGRDPKKGKLYRKVTKGRDLKRSIENACHDRYDMAWKGAVFFVV